MSSSRAPRLSARLLLALLAVLAIATLLAFAARLAWPAELAAHFRPQYAVAALLLAVTAALLRRRGIALAALAIALPNLWVSAPYLMPWLTPAADEKSAAPGVSLLSLNLYYVNTEHRRVKEYLLQAQPDVLVLSEYTPRWAQALRTVTGAYPYSVAADQHGAWGLAVYSRYPLTETRTTDLTVGGSFNVLTTVALPDGPLRLAAVHLASPTSPAHLAARNRQLQELAGLLAHSGRPRLVLGDMNITPFSPYFDDFLQHTGMRDARRREGMHGTWPRWLPPLQIAIDHCIADPQLRVTSVRRGPDIGSDHYPLEVRLSGATAPAM